tara:strand:+ start:137 stop:298 length:162 start_codon:yes stop_codon:yes gene_type:complete
MPKGIPRNKSRDYNGKKTKWKPRTFLLDMQEDENGEIEAVYANEEDDTYQKLM